MKSLKITAILLSFCACALAKDPPPTSGGPVIWAGVDYSMVRMIGPDFNSSQNIFPGMLDNWNNLFLKERIGRLSKKVGSSVIVDIDGVSAKNKEATAKQILPAGDAESVIEKSHLTESKIAKMVSSYKMHNKNGLGLVLIVDRLIKGYDKKGQAAVYVVFFDVDSRKVISSERQIHPAIGAGFRNYWFRPIKSAADRLHRP